MAKIDWIEFGEKARGIAGDIYISQQEIKVMRQKQKQKEEEFKLTKAQTMAEIQSKALKDAIELDKARDPEKYAKPGGIEEKGRAAVLAKLDEIYSKDPATWTPAEKNYVQNMAPYITRKQTDVTGTPQGGKGGAGAKTQLLSDIQKTYRKDFIHKEAQKWYNNVTKAVENNDWDTFMALEKDIPELETRISQGIAGTSEVVRPQISSATAYWSAIREQLAPELYKIPGARTEPDITGGAGAGIGAQVPEGLEAEVHTAQGLLDEATEWVGEGDERRIEITDENKYREGSKKLNELIKAHSQELIDSLMR